MSAPARAAGTPERTATRAAVCSPEELAQVAHAALVDLVDALPAAVSATVVTVTQGSRLRPWASSGPAGLDLDTVQAAAGGGPAVTAAADPDQLVVTGDVWADPRWDLAADGPTPPVRSVVATALPGTARARAVLVVHGTGPDLADPSVVEQVEVALPDLAAGVAVVQARLEVVDLQRALASNRVIGAAIGVAMSAHKLPYDTAAELLRTVSNHTNTRLADLAEQILLTGEVPQVLPRPRARRPVPRL
ncbi:ANTAR domain-containing protein [Klenkia sp. LSe6-5]|uniref:ANTAR domain-containing protein n=1 Tax=Klenkia sesuvii TaxID=3103137 RepID=A0ABU8DVR9_9ACTN